jgi:bacteriocin-like protein
MKFEQLNHELFEQISAEDMNKIQGGTAPETFISLTDIHSTAVEDTLVGARADSLDAGDTD